MAGPHLTVLDPDTNPSCHSFPHPPTPGGGYESPQEFELTVDAPGALPRPRPARPVTARTISTRMVPKLPPGAPGPGTTYPNISSIDVMVEKNGPLTKVRFRDRVRLYQWTCFTMTMATGGISNVLHSVPFRSEWLRVVGLAFYFFNIGLFITNCVLITWRFRMQKGSFYKSFTDQIESLFVPAFVVSIATILINTCQYAIVRSGHWLLDALEILFWIYMILAIFSSAFMYLVLWSTTVFPIHTMTPVWVFPAYPLLMAAPFAANFIAQANQREESNINSLAIACCAVCVQGTGFLISFMVIASFLYRLMTQKLPRDMQRPGVFISIGPSGFTVAGIVHLGTMTRDILPEGGFIGESRESVALIIKVMAVLVGLVLWGLSMWFFFVSVGSLFKYLKPDSRLPFLMTWWSFVFPNTALVTATGQLGKVFESDPLKILSCAMAGLLVCIWFLVFGTMVRAVYRRKLLWPEGTLPR